MEIAYSPPDARQRMHDLAETMIQLNGGLSDELRRILDKKADEFGVHRLDMEDILKELAPNQSASAQVDSPVITKRVIQRRSSLVPSIISTVKIEDDNDDKIKEKQRPNPTQVISSESIRGVVRKKLTEFPTTIINEKDSTKLVLIPEGMFLAGGPGTDEGGDDPFPVKLPAYYLALYPVTNIQYARFLSQGRPSKSDLRELILLNSDCFVRKAVSRYEAYGDKNDHPVVNVTWNGANAYAKWAGLRLPSELEWEKGARGVDGREYPWGNTWDKSKCRNITNQGDERTCSVQIYPEGRSPWGLYQMSGNILEWCEDWYDRNAYNRYRLGKLSPPSKRVFLGEIIRGRVLRGGSWNRSDPRCFRGAYRGPSARARERGFRLVRTVIL
jgi:formylglycine-generating enzyme required for sulfatase activity